MSRLVVFEHRGVQCAIPAGQVRRIARGESDETLALFGRDAVDAPRTAALQVMTQSGPRAVACVDAQFRSVDDRELHPLPDFLRSALNMAYVVGVTEVDGHFVWLVDLARWEDG